MNRALSTAFACAAVIVSATVLAACEDKTQATSAPTSAAPAAKTTNAPARPPATAAPAPAAAVELEEVKNEKLGYTIKVPKGSETKMADGNGGMYTKDTMIINVEPSGVKIASADDVLRAVNTGDGK